MGLLVISEKSLLTVAIAAAKEALVAVNEPEIFAAVNVRINVALAPSEPEISDANCSELDTKLVGTLLN